jgi:hypothetical protein
MLKLPPFFVAATASSSPFAWLALDAGLHSKTAAANITTSTAVRSKIVAPKHFKPAHVANETIPARDEMKRLKFWTLVPESKNQTYDVVVLASYQGGTESGLDDWSMRCHDGNEYSLRIEPNAKESVCTGRAFDRSTR